MVVFWLAEWLTHFYPPVFHAMRHGSLKFAIVCLCTAATGLWTIPYRHSAHCYAIYKPHQDVYSYHICLNKHGRLSVPTKTTQAREHHLLFDPYKGSDYRTPSHKLCSEEDRFAWSTLVVANSEYPLRSPAQSVRKDLWAQKLTRSVVSCHILLGSSIPTQGKQGKGESESAVVCCMFMR